MVMFGLTAMRVGAAGFVVPFMFIFEPSLLMIGEWPAILQSFTTAAIGTVCLAAGLFGYLVNAARMWERAFLVGAALLLIKPGLVTDLSGAVLLGTALASQFLRKRAETELPRPAPK